MYGRNARQLIESIEGEFVGLECAISEEKPRKGAFEINLVLPAFQEPIAIWSGLKKGPPRKLKFPDAAIIIDSIRSHLPS